MQAMGVPPTHALRAWSMVEGWITAALLRGKADTAPEQVREFLARDLMQLWLAWDGSRPKGCCVTEIVTGARGKVCNLVVVAGSDFAQWAPLLARIKQWARDQGCVRLEASGRAGWERHAREQGWRKVRTTIEMDL